MSITRRKGSPHYHYEFELGGRRFRGSTRATSRREAQAVERRKRKEAQELIASGRLEGARITLDEVMARYWRAHGHRTTWAASAKGHIEMILMIVGRNRPYLEIGNNDVASFVERRRAAGKLLKTRDGKVRRIGELSDSTIGKALSVWQAVHTMARDLWEMPVKPIAWSKHTPSEPDPRVTSIPPAKAKELLLALPENIQLAAWFALATGCRQGQIEQLTNDRVDIERRTIRVQRQKRKAKGNSWEVKHLNDMAVAVLRRAPRNTKNSELVFDFTNFRKHWAAARHTVGLPGFRFHDLRHVFATWLGENGASLQAVSKALGHSSISVTMKYLEVFDRHVRDAVHLLPALPDLDDYSGPHAPHAHRK